MTGNAYGLFVSGADGVFVDSSRFVNSQITGVDLHRFVRSSIIQRTTSTHSGGNGFSLGRATQGVQITQSSATSNANDGFLIAGQALADGPSAVGSSTVTYGNNSLSNSTATNNGHYGIHIQDGFNLAISANRLSGSRMGIVVEDNARTVSLTGNQVENVVQHGIALLDGVTASTVTGNMVNDGPIYLRDSQARVQGNTVLQASNHGISVVGASKGTVIANNVVGGEGPGAVDTARAKGSVTTRGNSTDGWHDSTPLLTRIKDAVIHPMTLLWGVIVGFVLLSMLRGMGRRDRRGGGLRGSHPYAHQMAHLAPRAS